VRISAGKSFTAVAPSAVAGLAEFHMRNMMMRQFWTIAGLAALGISMTAVAVGLAGAGGEMPQANRRPDDTKPVAQSAAERPKNSLTAKLDRLMVEYEGAQRAFMELYRGSTIPEENLAKAAKMQPDFPGAVRRIAEMAALAPKDPAVRDAMLWVIRQTKGGDDGPYAGEFTVTATWLVRHHGDDPDAVRLGLELDNWPSFCRDSLLFCFYASAKSRESKGLARLALAQYLHSKAMRADGARKIEGRPTYTHDDLVRADGTLYTEKEVMPDGDYAYLLHLKHCDVNYLRAEAERLYEEVIAEYSDVPYVTARDRMLEALLRQPAPKWNGQALTDEGRRRLEAGIARRRSTLGHVAEARLDDWHNLAVGKTAPEIKGVDVHGKSLTLSDYRGKVVALVFWGTWCGPCMREIPREKALVKRMKGRPFAMLGVNTDGDVSVVRKVMDAQGVAWPNWHDAEPRVEQRELVTTHGPIAKLYHVRGYPTVYVIDGKGTIRSKDSIGTQLDQLVEKLVVEQEAARK
jgi:peroxiredoxin